MRAASVTNGSAEMCTTLLHMCSLSNINCTTLVQNWSSDPFGNFANILDFATTNFENSLLLLKAKLLMLTAPKHQFHFLNTACPFEIMQE